MDMLRTIERPTNTTLRPYLWAASTTCCTRHVGGEAGDDDFAGGWANAGQGRADGGLGLDEAGHLGVGGVHHQQVHALSPILPNSTRSVMRWSSGSWSSHRPCRSGSRPGLDIDGAVASAGMEWVTLTNSRSKDHLEASHGRQPQPWWGSGGVPCTWRPRRRGQLEPTSGMSGRSLSR